MNIDDIYKMLNWEASSEEQEKGRILARSIEDLSLLIQPSAPVSVWEECAYILSTKTDEVLEPYLKSMLAWLKDLNWPGALTIFDRLLCFSGEKLIGPFLDSYICAVDLKENGLRWLYSLSELLGNIGLRERLPKEVLQDLQEQRQK